MRDGRVGGLPRRLHDSAVPAEGRDRIAVGNIMVDRELGIGMIPCDGFEEAGRFSQAMANAGERYRLRPFGFPHQRHSKAGKGSPARRLSRKLRKSPELLKLNRDTADVTLLIASWRIYGYNFNPDFTGRA
jgi:hypothetical protein